MLGWTRDSIQSNRTLLCEWAVEYVRSLRGFGYFLQSTGREHSVQGFSSGSGSGSRGRKLALAVKLYLLVY